jgi:tryptophan halogenase
MDEVSHQFDFSTIGNRPPIDTGGLWNHESYECILYGMHYLQKESYQWFGESRPPTQPSPRVKEFLGTLSQLPDHAEWLQTALGMLSYHTSDAPKGWPH